MVTPSRASGLRAYEIATLLTFVMKLPVVTADL